MKLYLDVNWALQKICLQEPFEGKILWTVDFKNRNTVKGAEMQVQITAVQKVGATITIEDLKGNPATVDGVPAWVVSDEAGLSVLPSTDGLSAEIVAVGPAGSYQVTVTVDADLGEGVKSLTGALDVIVVAAEAAVIEVVAGVPENQ